MRTRLFGSILGASMCVALAGVTVGVDAQQQKPAAITAEQLSASAPNPSQWLMFGGDYGAKRHSPLTQITPQNVGRLVHQWTFQNGTQNQFETTPLVYDGVLYVTGLNNTAWAIDARTGKTFWRYRRQLPEDLRVCCGPVNRGFGVLAHRLFMATLDAHLVALDSRTGEILWDIALDDYKKGYASTIAPLVVKNKVIVGVAGGEYGAPGFIAAFDPETGKRLWKFSTVPAPGEKGSETWEADSAERGGAGVWVTGTHDPELNLVYFGTGNPSPDFHGDDREGDNLFSNSLVALDTDTGAYKWHYQFTPHDVHDWDSTHVPILADLPIRGQQRKVVMVANRNGFFYTIDRTNGALIVAKPYVHTTWAKEIGADGRPVLLPDNTPNDKGTVSCPDLTGGTNFYPPSYDPTQRLFLVNVRETCATYFGWKQDFKRGEWFLGGATQRFDGPQGTFGALRAIDPATGDRRWELKYPNPGTAGVLTTASGIAFTGDDSGHVLAVDGKSGKLLWNYQMGAPVHGTSPITYMLGNKQYVLVPAGSTLVAFALPDPPR
ncbi:MAG: PQQ-dependent dehydrogenase, methanol/ethanol family [Acidimicrobiia bacterium]|nr:PQQ-dependent dehydrogenase, methanol/ethanol family [Acidimicrobiia bacterium]